MIRFSVPAEATALVSVERFNAENGIEGEDEARDLAVAQHIAAATLAIERSCAHVNFGAATAVETFDGKPVLNGLWLSHWPVNEIVSVTEDGEAVAAEDFELDNSRQLWRMREGRRSNWSTCRIVVTYTGGYVLPDECPDDLAGVCLERAAASWSARGRDPKVKAEDVPGVMKLEYWVGSTDDSNGGFSEASAAVLMNYRNFAFG